MDKFKAWWAAKDKRVRKRFIFLAIVGAIVLLAILSNGFNNDGGEATNPARSSAVLQSTSEIA